MVILTAPQLGGLSTTLSFRFPFAKSSAAKAASAAQYIKQGFKNWDGGKLPYKEP
jgi:hypothetical protein